MRNAAILFVVLASSTGCAEEMSKTKVPAPEARVATRSDGSAYPAAPRGGLVEEHHGVKVADPYRWLEEMDSPQTKAWVAAENVLTDNYLRHVAGRDALRARIAELVRHPTVGVPVRRGGRYFWPENDGRKNQSVVMTSSSLDSPPTVLLDPNLISTDGSLALADFVVDNGGKRLAYGLSIGGGDWQRWPLRDVSTQKDLPDELENIKYYRPAFTKDDAGIYYSRFPAPQKGKELVEPDHDCKVYHHRIGTPAAQDVVVYERPDHPTWQFDLAVTKDGHYLVITIGDGQVGDRSQEQIAYLDLQKPGAKPVALIDAFDVEYVFVGSDGPVFFVKTTLGAPKKRIVAIDVNDPARDHWKTVVPEGAETIDDASFVGGQFLVTTLHDAHSRVTAYDRRGKRLHDVALPGLGSAWGFGGRPEDTETFYYYTSFVEPGTVYRADLATSASKPWRSTKVSFDSSKFETRQVFYPSHDKTMVPMFVTSKKGLVLDGSNPTIVNGYGFGGISSTPYFESSKIAWLERGGVFAVANIRGGGEYGEAWHEASKRTHRQVGIDDFIAAGEWLIANKYTSRERLGAMGTSGGGMLVGAALVQRPDLYGAVVPIAGVLDLLRFQLFGQGAGWQGDMGSPDDPTEFRALLAYSPLHNVKPRTRYPAVFVVTSDHDVRVAPLHSYKFAAALQQAQGGEAPILMRVEVESGHGGGSTLDQEIDQSAEILAFLAANLGLPLK
jgi:prolyl oligopeptidase